MTPRVIAFETFWHWLQVHVNCIISAGTPESVLFDHDDFHWHFCSPPPGANAGTAMLVQVIRGKQLVGELLIDPQPISYVQIDARGPEEFAFECVEQSKDGAQVRYSFTLSHDYDPAEVPNQGRWVH